MAVTVVERHHSDHPIIRGILGIFPTVLLLGGITMIVLGALCVSGSRDSYDYCRDINFGGGLALLIIGSVLTFMSILQYIFYSRTVWRPV